MTSETRHVSPDTLERLAQLPRTDAGNGEAFAALFSGEVAFDHTRQRWLIFEGHTWHEDGDDSRMQLAKLTARARLQAAALVDDSRERDESVAWARRSESNQALTNMLRLASTEPAISTLGHQWDTSPLLLGCINGVLRLDTGQLVKGEPSQRITLRTPVAYSASESCPRWRQFLDEVFGDAELIDFVQRAVGYSFTGDVSEQVVFLCHGTGANGKSTFLEVLRDVAGDYGANLPFSALEYGKAANGGFDIAQLPEKRIATASETTDGARFNEGRIKALTGGDSLTAAPKYKNPFEFQPRVKLWLAVNHLPTVRDDSYGFWRRVRVLSFRRQFSGAERDPKLREHLRKELPGILAWIAEGVRMWLRDGLVPPTSVMLATEAYRQDEDWLGQFLSDCCLVGDGHQVGAGDIYARYRQWAAEQGMPPPRPAVEPKVQQQAEGAVRARESAWKPVLPRCWPPRPTKTGGLS